MRLVVRLITILCLIVGGILFARKSSENRLLKDQIDQLEAELGHMPIEDANLVHLVEIETPAVPPEVARHLERVWQFRCYLPPGYDVIRFSGGGRVTKEGVYQSGGSSSGWGSPQKEADHKLLTVSVRKKDDHWEVFSAFGGSSGTSSWSRFLPDRIDEASMVQKIVSSEYGPRSFDQDTILPILRVIDPTTAKVEEVAGKTLTTYNGGIFVLCPKSRQSEFEQLQRGNTPAAFDPSWIAGEASDE